MNTKNVETLIREREDLRDLLEDIKERIQEFREEMLTELDDLEDMIADYFVTGHGVISNHSCLYSEKSNCSHCI